MQEVTFENITSEKIRKSFLRAFNRYPLLQSRRIFLRQVRLKNTTMQAQPVVSICALFSGSLDYQIKLAQLVRDSDSLTVQSLPEKVLIGWFAHELGHIQDYISRTPLQMIVYGFRYFLSSNFRKTAEHEADRIAIQNGFDSEILSVKRFIFNHDLVDERYKNQMRKYYMSIEEVETCIQTRDAYAPVALDR